MKKKAFTAALLLLWTALTLGAWFGPTKEISDAERRKLAQLPELTWDSLTAGKFATDFERYTLDQFPLRDSFRQLKALTHYYALGQKDKDGIYLQDGYAAQQVSSLNTASVDHALDRFRWVYDRYLQDSRVYFALIPDKNALLAQAAGQPSVDYDALYARVQGDTPWAVFLDLRESLTLSDYYRTDTHWKQERLLPVAAQIATAMGNPVPREADYTQVTLERPFYGVYYGQAALPMAPDTLTMLTNEMLEDCAVFDFETNQWGSVYDESKETSRDLYDVYLSGARALLTIENPAGEAGKELLIFRDSFGSALTPLLLGNYSKITLIDLRYIAPELLETFLTFHGQDTLFLYSTLVLNESSAIK